MIHMPADAERQAAFDALFDEFDQRYGFQFHSGWYYGREQTLIDRFWRELALKVAGCTIDELGAALNTNEPTHWEHERLPWIFLLGNDASSSLEAGNRGQLLAITSLSGKLDQARSWGIRM